MEKFPKLYKNLLDLMNFNFQFELYDFKDEISKKILVQLYTVIKNKDEISKKILVQLYTVIKNKEEIM